MTDRVPLFIKEGHILFQQDTEKVVNTKQLDNHFVLLSGLRFDSRRSNATHKGYVSVGAILSIKDYHNDTLVDLCTREGCEYVFTFVASISSILRTLQIDIAYLGGRDFNQQIFID